jgi:hypothetical protein
MSMKKTIVVASILAALSSGVATAQKQDIGLYAGVLYSKLDTDVNNASTDPSMLTALAGYKFNRNFAVEGILGKGISDTTLNLQNTSLDFEAKTIKGASAVGIFPIDIVNLKLYGKLGYAKIDYEDGNNNASDGSGAMYGIGAGMKFSSKLSFHLEYMKYPDGESDNNDVSFDVDSTTLNFGVYYNF